MSARAPIRPTRVAIDLGAAVENARRIRQLAGGAELFAVVKADAYGHGAVAVSRALAAAGVARGFAVSLVEEGVELREAGVAAPILVMGPALDGGTEELVARDMIPLVSDLGDLEALAEIGRRRGAPVEVHLKIDTGMGRLGFLPGAIDRALATPGVSVTGLATHFACADTDDPSAADSMTARQLSRFLAEAARARASGAPLQVLHAANSAGALRFPAARLDWIRPGIALYGNFAGAGLCQVMSLVTEIVQIRHVPAGASVSYGALWRSERPSRLGVLPLGYADGLPRALTGRAEVLVGGQRCPVVGAICMDITLVDVTALGDAARVGDAVILLGSQHAERIGVREFAERAGLIEYEVTCGISKRVPRVYE